MKNYKIIVVEDEANNLEAIELLINKYCLSAKIVVTTDTLDGLTDLINIHKPDIVFLDIEVKGENSIEYFLEKENRDFEIIVLTAYSQYAIDAIRLSVVDYLLKPIDIDLLQKAYNKTIERIEFKNKLFNLEHLSQIKKLAIPTVEGLAFINFDDIVLISAVSNYSNIHTVQGNNITVSKSLNYFEPLLPLHQFFRVHRSHIINLHYITKYHKGRGGYIELSNGKQVDVSSRIKDAFISLFRED